MKAFLFVIWLVALACVVGMWAVTEHVWQIPINLIMIGIFTWITNLLFEHLRR